MNIKLLHWGRTDKSYDYETGSHCHPFYQLEICVSGKQRILADHSEYILKSGEFLLIPAATQHQTFWDKGSEFFSLKFESDFQASRIRWYRDEIFHGWIVQTLRGCYEDQSAIALLPIGSNRVVLESLLAAILFRLEQTCSSAEISEPPVFGKIRDIVNCTSSCLSVAECAEHMSMDQSQLNYQFSKELKQYGLSPEEYSIKKLIDSVLLMQINRFLDFTPLSISEIAEKMHFNNPYTFSRFYRRLTGYPPTLRRK